VEGFRVQGSGFRVQGKGVSIKGFRVSGFGFGVVGSGFMYVYCLVSGVRGAPPSTLTASKHFMPSGEAVSANEAKPSPHPHEKLPTVFVHTLLSTG
jgi:hypothetical protein